MICKLYGPWLAHIKNNFGNSEWKCHWNIFCQLPVADLWANDLCKFLAFRRTGHVTLTLTTHALLANISYFFEMGQTHGLFSVFSHCKDKYSTNLTINYYSIDGVVGTRTRTAVWNPLSYGGTSRDHLIKFYNVFRMITSTY